MLAVSNEDGVSDADALAAAKAADPGENRLKMGDHIRVHGWVMLAGLDAGDYRVTRVSDYHGRPAYSFAKPRGKKTVARHYAASVDCWINPGHLHQNRIEVL
jgi:hypothetical protein